MSVSVRDPTADPFVGLDFFTEDDAAVFFGRDATRKTIINNLQGARLTVLYAESGVGKSSLLRAGVASKLTALAQRGSPRSVPIVFSRWNDDPVATLVEEIERAVRPFVATNDELELPRDRLDTAIALASQAMDATPMLILDQFEDYFLYQSSGDDGGRFAAQFPQIVEHSGLRVSFLISIREDALASLDYFQGSLSGVLDNRLQLKRLTREEARQAIEGPIHRYNEAVPDHPVSIEPSLVDAVLDELVYGEMIIGAASRGSGQVREHAADAVEAPFLQLVMTKLWAEETASGSSTLRRETYERLGGAERIIHGHLRTVMGVLTEPEQRIASAAFQQLVTPSGRKIAHSVGDLAQLTAQPQEKLAPVVEQLANPEARILRVVEQRDAGAGKLEIFHDVLAHAVLDWRAEFETKEARRLAKETTRRELTNRFFRIAVVALLLAVIVAAALTIFALKERDRARSSALIANASQTMDSDPELALLLAREAYRRDSSAAATESLVRGLSGMHLLATMRARGAVDPLQRDASSFTPDGTRVVTSSGVDVDVWNVETGERSLALAGHAGRVTSVAFSPDGRLVLSASEDGTARIWDAGSGRASRVLRGPSTGVNGAHFSPDGRLVVTSGGVDETAQLWSAASGRLVRTLRTPGSGVYAVAFDAPGRRLVTSGVDGSASVWDVRSGRRLLRLSGHAASIYGASFNRPGTRIVTTSLDGTAHLWNARTGRPVARLGAVSMAAPAVFSPDGTRAVTTESRRAFVWDAETGEQVARLEGHDDMLSSASFSPDGTLVATASDDQTAIIWDVATERPWRSLRGHLGAVVTAVFAPSGRRIVTTSEDRTARAWEAYAGTIAREHDGAVSSLAVSPDGRTIVTGGADGTARRWDVEARRIVGAPLRHQAELDDIAFSADGERIVTVDNDLSAGLWNARTGRLERVFQIQSQEPADAFTAADVSSDGRSVVLATLLSGVQVFDLRTGRAVGALAHGEPVNDAGFNADGTRVISASDDGEVRIWDWERARLVVRLRGHRGRALTAEFSRDDRYAVSSSSDRSAIVWDLATMRPSRTLASHTGPVNAARFSADAQRVITAGDTTTRIWDRRDGRLLGIVPAHAETVRDVVAVPRGDLLASTGDDGALRVYRCTTCVSGDALLALSDRRVTRDLTGAERARLLPDDP